MARILVLGVKVPFTHGGQEVLVGTLVKQLRARGHEADVVEIPFNPLPKQNLVTQAAMWRALDLTEFAGTPIDLVIATKFPSYYARHPRKSVWLVHQLRSIYDLYGGQYSDIGDDPRDESMRRLLTDGDTMALNECAYRSCISKNVAERLKAFNGLHSRVLYPPLPMGDQYRSAPPEPYILSVGRICRIKRLDLIINAMPHIDARLKLKVVGVADEPGAMEFFTNEMNKHNLSSRIEFLGRVGDQELLDLYSKATGVFYAPFDEDYGYVTLEAMASGRPIVTATDSGGTLEFVRDRENGRVVAPNPLAMAEAFNSLVNDPVAAEKMGTMGRMLVEEAGMLSTGWDDVINGLLSPLAKAATSEMTKVVGG
jgi:glycosyltransferase involved in cell wall biosynthesis